MRNLVLIMMLTVSALLPNAYSQQSLDSYLEAVRQNNKVIQSGNRYTEAKIMESKTGLTPSNPIFEFGYFPGNSDPMGTKKVMGVSQQFEFPTTYIQRKQVWNQETKLLETELLHQKQQVMLEAWKTWCNAVYYNKKTVILDERLKNAQLMVDYYLKKQENGDATQLEFNKARLFLIDIKNKVRLNTSLKSQNSKKMAEINGGVDFVTTDTAYKNTPPEDWPTIKSKIEKEHPLLKQLQAEQELAQRQLSLSKSLWLPDFSVGYESEDVLGDVFRGVKAGISIPLWENKNEMKKSKAALAYAGAREEEMLLTIYSGYQRLHTKATALYENLYEFNNEMLTMDNQYLLSRSLELGQISAIEYFMELAYFYDIEDELLNLKLEFQKAYAELYRFSL